MSWMYLAKQPFKGYNKYYITFYRPNCSMLSEKWCRALKDYLFSIVKKLVSFVNYQLFDTVNITLDPVKDKNIEKATAD